MPLTQKLNEKIAEIEKEFEDFYWEQGKYKGRNLGLAEYKKFIRSAIQKLIESSLPREKEEFEIKNPKNSNEVFITRHIQSYNVALQEIKQ